MSNQENDSGFDLELEYHTTAVLRENKAKTAELLTFSLPIFGQFEIAIIVMIPGQGDMESPVYVKIRRSRRLLKKTEVLIKNSPATSE
jgi:hypothetical protein